MKGTFSTYYEFAILVAVDCMILSVDKKMMFKKYSESKIALLLVSLILVSVLSFIFYFVKYGH